MLVVDPALAVGVAPEPGLVSSVVAALPDPLRALVAEAPAVTVGKRPPRATPAAARAARNCASAWAIDWLETDTCSSSASSCGPPKSCHHLPRGISSRGVADFQFGGGGSLKAAGELAGGRR